MADFEPGDRVEIKTDYYDATEPDWNSGQGVIVMKGCGLGCVCGNYYEVLHDKEAQPGMDWRTVGKQHLTPYSADELTKIS